MRGLTTPLEIRVIDSTAKLPMVKEGLLTRYEPVPLRDEPERDDDMTRGSATAQPQSAE